MPLRFARLLHPAYLLALAVLLLNDHVLKEAVPGVLTGKLSDVAGLIVLPVLLTTLLRVPSRQLVWAVHGTVGLAFAALQFVPPEVLWQVFPVQHTPDPTDLLALAILPLGVRLSLADVDSAGLSARQLEGRVRPVLAHLVGLVAVGAVLATSPPRAPLVVEATPVEQAETPRDALRQLEARFAALGFDAHGSEVAPYEAWIARQEGMSDDDAARALHQQISDNTESRLEEGDEYYRVQVPAGQCSAAPSDVTLLFHLNTIWETTTRELAIVVSEIDFGAGDWQFADEDTRAEGRRLAQACVVEPLLSES